MKRFSSPLDIGLLLALIGLGSLGGCPLDLSRVAPATEESLPTDAGYYWVEHVDEDLSLFQMPRYRDEPGTWWVVSGVAPDWYAGPGLYLLNEAGSWVPEASAADVTLDDLMLTWDVGPRPPNAGGSVP